MSKTLTNKKNKNKPLRISQIEEAKWENKDGDIQLDLPDNPNIDLPFVTVITITKNKRPVWGIPLYNWKKFIYPENRLEWLILDDGDDTMDIALTQMMKEDRRIRYVKCDPMDIGSKRNKAVELAKYDYIVHMDDDDYYVWPSILAKIRVMLHYKKECVFSKQIGIYDILTEKSNVTASNFNIPEASMAYTKSFWSKRKFEGTKCEANNLIRKRERELITIPFWFNCIICTYKLNYTTRYINLPQENCPSTSDLFDPDFKIVLGYVKNRVLKVLEENEKKS